MIKDVLKKIDSPDSLLRGAPFWAWNAKLEDGELVRQIRFMKDMGLGGFFMHARVGLNTPYLSKEWFDRVKTCVKEAKKLGMKAWLYDEDRWPSGAGGGLVTKDQRYAMRRLYLTVADKKPADTKKFLACFAGKFKKEELKSYRKFDPAGDALEKGESFLGFDCRIDEKSTWYNGETYLDVLNEDAVARFIEVTHKAYKKNIGADFGKTVPGIFTDEPSFQDWMPDAIAWTDSIPEKFGKKFGYSILDRLPELFYRVDGKIFSKTRLDFRDMLATLFVNSFSKQIGKWCAENNMAFTGHVLEEDTLCSQSKVVGSAMRFYEYMQYPGIDLLTEHWEIFDTAKQCSSVAHQFSKPVRLSETYGCTGWDFPFAGHKALGDWQLALGINLRCPHLAWYSMEAEAKRDYPASIFHQSPWYTEYGHVEDYFARLNAALSEGSEQRDLLVIHPVESTWGIMSKKGFDDKARSAENITLIELRNTILSANIDFDYGEEEILSRNASVENGLFKVADASYKAILVPELRTIRWSTLELLMRFKQAGGKIFCLGDAPEYVDGYACTAAREAFAKFTKVSKDDLVSKISPVVRRVSITDGNGKETSTTLHIFRSADDHDVIFACNYGMKFSGAKMMNTPGVSERNIEYPSVTLKMTSKKEYSLFELDPATGAISPVNSTWKNGWRSVKTSFPKLGSRCFIASAKNIATVPAAAADSKTSKKIQLSASGWDYVITDENVLILDHASYTVGKGKPSAKKYFIAIDDELRDMLGAEHRGGSMTQPWVNRDKAQKPDKVLDLTLTYSFEVKSLPEGTTWLALERPDLYSFSLNGKKFTPKDSGYWKDGAIRKLALPQKGLVKGKNTLELKSKFHKYLPGLESAFILGDFGIEKDRITALPDSLAAGDWCEQGFTNYAGNMTYLMTQKLDPAKGKRYILELPEWRGAAVAISVNGGKKTFMAWPPYSADITEFLAKGENSFAITVLGHLRNAFGPFYCGDRWPYWTGSGQFKDYKTKERVLVPCGLLKPPVIKF